MAAGPVLSEASAQSEPRRYNRPLDYLRVTALLLMVFVHTMRPFLGWAGVDGVLISIGEAAPFPFFLALGMTTRRLVAKSRDVQLTRLGWFGLVALSHSYFMWFRFSWEFFMCLWVVTVAVAVIAAAGLRPPYFSVLGIVLLLINVVVPLTPAPPAGQPVPPDFWLRYGPFFPLPWAAVIFVGMGIGLDYPQGWRRPLVLLPLLATVAVALLECRSVAPGEPIGLRFLTEKNHATSAYMVAGIAASLSVYLGLGWLPQRASIDAAARYISERLLLATVLHHLAVRIITDPRWHWSSSVAFQRAASWTEVIAIFVSSVGTLFLLLVVVEATWALVVRRLGERLDRIRLSWAIACVVGALYLMRHWIGWIGTFSFRWTAFVLMLLAALLGDRARRTFKARPSWRTQ